MNILSEKIEIYCNNKKVNWTKIEDKKPNINEWCYVTINSPRSGLMVVEGVYDEDGVWWTYYGPDDFEEITALVIAWMPLRYPTPYNGDTILSQIITESKLDDLQLRADEKAKEFMFNNLEETANEVINIHEQIQETLKEEKQNVK